MGSGAGDVPPVVRGRWLTLFAVEQLRLPGELVGDLCGCQPANARNVTARAEISRLRAAGYSAAETARSLNARGVSTPSGRGQWWAATVQYHGYPGVKARRDAYIAARRARQRLQRAG